MEKKKLTGVSVAMPGEIYDALEDMVEREWNEALEHFNSGITDGSALLQVIPVMGWLREVEARFWVDEEKE